MTYEMLFAYLTHVGFHDRAPTELEHVFEHSELGILLALTLSGNAAIDGPVRGADVTSVEFRLQQHGLLTGPLADAVGQASTAGRAKDAALF
jgi:hypothetical protein